MVVFTFDTPVTLGTAQVVGGTATAGAPTFSGNEQIVSIHVSSVYGSSGSDDVDFGFLIADANASRTVESPDLIAVRSHRGQTVTAANFHDDITLDGVIGGLDRRMTKLE